MGYDKGQYYSVIVKNNFDIGYYISKGFRLVAQVLTVKFCFGSVNIASPSNPCSPQIRILGCADLLVTKLVLGGCS